MKKIVLWILVILWMCLIFYFSNENSTESTNKSRGIINSTNIVEKYESTEERKEELLETVDVYFRKFAHGLVYLVLSILVCFLVNEYKLDIKKILLIAFIVCFIYSCSDEIHQLYVPGRSGEIRDIIIDNIGSLMGLIIFYLVKVKKWRKQND